MTIVYTGPHEGVDTPEGVTFVKGVPTEVSEALGDVLTVRDDFDIVKDGQ
jgi:hypothetical protein